LRLFGRHILAYLGLSRLISSHRILFILPAEHYSFYRPNTPIVVELMTMASWRKVLIEQHKHMYVVIHKDITRQLDHLLITSKLKSLVDYISTRSYLPKIKLWELFFVWWLVELTNVLDMKQNPAKQACLVWNKNHVSRCSQNQFAKVGLPAKVNIQKLISLSITSFLYHALPLDTGAYCKDINALSSFSGLLGTCLPRLVSNPVFILVYILQTNGV
jgi:hypothetical protein